MSEERWLQVPGFDQRYMVSDHGRVGTNGGYFRIPASDGGEYLIPKKGYWQLLQPSLTLEGYWKVNLREQGETRTVLVHHLVALVFVGPSPGLGYETHHKDRNPQNNHFSNFEWLTIKAHRQLPRKRPQ